MWLRPRLWRLWQWAEAELAVVRWKAVARDLAWWVVAPEERASVAWPSRRLRRRPGPQGKAMPAMEWGQMTTKLLLVEK